MFRFGVFALLLPFAAHTAQLARIPNTTVNAAQVDAAGNIYIAGYEGTANKPATYDAFISKLSPDGSKVLYTTVLAGSDSDVITSLAIDPAGSAYAFGQTQSSDFAATSGSGQGFAVKLDAAGKVVYTTRFGGDNEIFQLKGGVAVDSAGDAFISGYAVGKGFPSGNDAPFTANDPVAYFSIKLDAAGKLVAGIRGIGGIPALDPQGNLYVGSTPEYPSGDPVTPGAFQSKSSLHACGGTGQLAFGCPYQFIAKLNGSLTHIVYGTYVAGTYGADPAAIWVDAQGNATVAGTTNSPDYPTTPNTFQPDYIAAKPQGPNVNLFGTIYPPPASGYVTKLNASGTGLIESTLFSGTQADTITFAAPAANGIYLSGQAGSDDLPGIDGVPQQCLPATFVSRMSTDATSVSSARLTSGTVLAYDPTTSTVIVWDGVTLSRFDPASPPPPVSCVVDALDLGRVDSVAPGELLTFFGPHLTDLTYTQTTPAPAPFPTTLGPFAVTFNGIPAPLLYVSSKQINVQAPFELSGSPSANILVDRLSAGMLPVTPTNPSVSLDTVTPLASLDACAINGSHYNGGPLPKAFNIDGSPNTCNNPAPRGTPVWMILDGLGVTPHSATDVINNGSADTPQHVITATEFRSSTTAATVVSVTPLEGSLSGMWRVTIMPTADTGAIPITLSVDGVPVRDSNVTIWTR